MRSLACVTLFVGILLGLRAYVTMTFNDVMKKATDPKSAAFKMPTTYTPAIDFTKVQKFQNYPTINPGSFKYVPRSPPRISIPAPPTIPGRR